MGLPCDNTLLSQVAWVPGSFELPVVAKSMARSGRFDAVVTVGAVVGPRRHTVCVWVVKTLWILSPFISSLAF